MPRPRLGTERRHTLRASLRNQNACPHVTRDIRRATFYGNLRETSRGPDWAQNDGADVVRACAVEMHVKISQEPLFTEIYRENAAAQIGPRTQTYTLCEPASKCMSTCHKRHQKSHFIRQITGKMPRPRLGPKRRRRRCASLRSRNACQDFTRATFYGNLQEKCRGPDWAQNCGADVVRACAVETRVKISQDSLYTEILRKNAAAQSEHPDQAPAFTPRKNPSLWTYCLGKNQHNIHHRLHTNLICKSNPQNTPRHLPSPVEIQDPRESGFRRTP